MTPCKSCCLFQGCVKGRLNFNFSNYRRDDTFKSIAAHEKIMLMLYFAPEYTKTPVHLLVCFMDVVNPNPLDPLH